MAWKILEWLAQHVSSWVLLVLVLLAFGIFLFFTFLGCWAIVKDIQNFFRKRARARRR